MFGVKLRVVIVIIVVSFPRSVVYSLLRPNSLAGDTDHVEFIRVHSAQNNSCSTIALCFLFYLYAATQCMSMRESVIVQGNANILFAILNLCLCHFVVNYFLILQISETERV